MESCQAVYSFLLDNRESMVIEGYVAATLGHMKHDNDVIEHNYYGDKPVVTDLRKLDGFNQGQVVITNDMIKRDPNTGWVIKITK